MILAYNFFNIMIVICLIWYVFFGSEIITLKKKYLITSFFFIFYAFGILLFTVYSFSFINLLWTIIASYFWAFVTKYYYRNFCIYKKLEKYRKEQEIRAHFQKCKPEDIIEADYKVVK